MEESMLEWTWNWEGKAGVPAYGIAELPLEETTATSVTTDKPIPPPPNNKKNSKQTNKQTHDSRGSKCTVQLEAIQDKPAGPAQDRPAGTLQRSWQRHSK